MCKNYVGSSELGARVLKKTYLSSSSLSCNGILLEALGCEVGINLEGIRCCVNVDWNARVFTDA